MKNRFTVARVVILGVLVSACLLFGILLIVSTATYREQKKEYSELSLNVTDIRTEDKELSSDDVMPYNVNWDNLFSVNPEIIGWVIIPGTVVSYPICLTDNNDYYINHSFSKEKMSSGSVFMDCENHSDFDDFNTILYGHNMRNGSMFAVLNKYADKEFYTEHDEVWILTPVWQRKYKIISAQIAIAGDATFDMIKSTKENKDFIDREVSESLYEVSESLYEVSDADSGNTLVLSTCNKHNSNKRFVLVCQPEAQYDYAEYSNSD